jgi:glycosyltransferase involved in cell wall biosynthesis
VILPILKIRGKKIVVTIHNITPHVSNKFAVFIDKILNKMVFLFTDIFIVHNQKNKEKLIELYGIDGKYVPIITHGTLKPYGPLKNISKEIAREKLDVPLDKKVILYFGYLWEYKGVDILLESLNSIKEVIQNITLIIAGQPLKNWEKYDKIIKKNHLDNYILKKLEYIQDSDIELYFSCADLVVLPYKSHPFDTHGGVGALAIFFKKPLIVTDVGGLPEYVKDKKMILNPNDPV